MTSGSAAPALDRPPSRGRTRLTAVLLAVCALLSLSAWALSGPVDSTPDEDFHMASIWCGWGKDGDHCAPGKKAHSASVPRDLVKRSKCFAFKPDASAGCLGAGFGTDPAPDFSTTRGNFADGYPPVFYAAMRTFVGDDVSASVLRMRLFNTVFTVGLIGLLMLLLPTSLRRVLAVTVLAAAVPLGLYLTSSINPSGWAVLSASTFWLSLWAVTLTRGRRRVGLAGIAVLSALVGAGARVDSALFTLLGIVLVGLLAVRAGRPTRWFWGTAGVSAVVSVYFFLSASQSSSALSAFGDGRSDLSFTQLAWYNLTRLPLLWSGSLGQFPIGWIDTVLPEAVFFGAFLVWTALVFSGWQTMTVRKGLALLMMVAALVVYPMYLLTRSELQVGDGVQPRYLLPMLVMFTGASLLQAPGRALVLTTAQRLLVALALTYAYAVALHTEIRRYVTGTDVVGFNLDRAREWWWWGGPVTPMVVWFVGSAAFALLTVLVLRSFTREVPEAETEAVTAPA